MPSKQEALNVIDQFRFTSGMPYFDPEVVTSIGRSILKVRYGLFIDRFLPYEIKISPKFKTERDWSIGYFRDKAESFGLNLPDPFILYIDHTKAAAADGSILALENKRISIPSAVQVGPLIIIAVRPKELNLSLAAKTHHEIGHYFSLTHYHVLNLPSPINRIRSGATVETHEGVTRGTLFEEGYVRSETEDYINTRGKQKLPLDYLFLNASLPQAVEQGEAARYLSTFTCYNISLFRRSFDFDVYHTDDFIDIHRELTARIPNFIDILEQARATGKWNGLGRLIDNYYGPGVFRLLMSINMENLGLSILKKSLQLVKKEVPGEELRGLIIGERSL
ncbi:hypothetical protein A2960_03370 [Candidatus Gottesmanbacteria bacterium RIFCSPLOWO2_01_FULL_39_12b]|uniref:Uncharacterized protein n=1 Tax=Candidatus Gottesmanbacteria bacterium RIFCSPLOWO2_01_FULL_39_12b TaxID=1798388 RepID=A0A1F6ANT1_9BACT|nr:MAG: hypothetical protein A2960_03370 [Candidatus Gottesmanbacteria bacterium RIFCSPLOWO2_01_FULL_39_12b]